MDLSQPAGPAGQRVSPPSHCHRQKIYAIFDAQTERTAEKRYAEVLASREKYVQETPAAAAIFDFLERH